MALNYDNISTTTLQLIRKNLADAIFKANPTAYFFLAKGRVKLASGGKWIEEGIKYAKNSTIQSYSGYDLLNVNPTEEFTMSKYTWKQIAGSVSMSGLEDLENSGESQIFNLLKEKISILEMSMEEKFDEMIHAASTSKAAKDWLGLDELIENVAEASQGTVGGINRTTYPWWRNRYKSDGSFANLTSDMRKFYNDCSKGITTPDLLMMAQNIYEAYEDQNAGKLRYSDTNLLDAGFDNIKFKGGTMMWNENCQAGLIYFINTKYLSMTIHKRRNFVMTPFVTPYNQDAKVAQMLVAGNMTVSNSRFQGVMAVA